MCHMLGTEMIHFVHQMQYYITFEVRTRGGGGGAPYGFPGVPNTPHVSHAGNRNDPLCPSDAVLHHLRGKSKGPEGVLPTGIPVSPILHMCHMLGIKMIHFVHQMQYYITFKVRTRGLSGVLPTGSPVSPTLHMCHMLGTDMIHFIHQMQSYITFEVRERGPRGGYSQRGTFFRLMYIKW